MGSGEYKTLQTTTELSSLMRQMLQRLQSLEERLERVEQKVSKLPAMTSGAQAAGPGVLESSGVSVSMSGSPTTFGAGERELMLAPADEQIVQLIRARGNVCASDVQIKFKYKGRNAASARLSRLYELGLLEKAQAGRVVYYRMRTA